MSVEREIKARIVGKFKCREFIYLGNTVLIIELKSKEETVELTVFVINSVSGLTE